MHEFRITEQPQSNYLVTRFCPKNYWGWIVYSLKPSTGQNAVGAGKILLIRTVRGSSKYNIYIYYLI